MSLGSFLKKLGTDIAGVFGKINQVEKAAEPFIEAFLPGSIPFFSVFDEIADVVKTVETGAATVGAAVTGQMKLAAALPAVQQVLDQWVTQNLPGAAAILKSEQYIAGKIAAATGYINTTVTFLNSLPPSPTPTPATPALAATAGIVAQAVAASNAATQAVNKPVS